MYCRGYNLPGTVNKLPEARNDIYMYLLEDALPYCIGGNGAIGLFGQFRQDRLLARFPNVAINLHSFGLHRFS